MRKALLAVIAVLLLGLSAYLSARMQTEGARVRLRLVDAADGSGQPGLVRVFRQGEATPLALPGLTDRLCGLDRSDVVGVGNVQEGAAEQLLRTDHQGHGRHGSGRGRNAAVLTFGGCHHSVTPVLRDIGNPVSGEIDGSSRAYFRDGFRRERIHRI